MEHGVTLEQRHINMINNCAWLCDNVMMMAMRLLEHQENMLGIKLIGCQSTAVAKYEGFCYSPYPSIQFIHGGRQQHWIISGRTASPVPVIIEPLPNHISKTFRKRLRYVNKHTHTANTHTGSCMRGRTKQTRRSQLCASTPTHKWMDGAAGTALLRTRGTWQMAQRTRSWRTCSLT